MPAALVLFLLAGPAAEEVQDAAARVLADDGYQTEIPDKPAPEGAPPSDRSPDEYEPYVPPSEAVATVASALWWVAIAVVVVLVGLWLARELALGRDARPPPPEAVVTRPAAAAAPVLPDADALARAGRYADAVHALLLRVIAALDAPRPSWTGREVARRAELAPDARRALGHLVLAVEASLFGGRPAGEAEYRACAEHGRAVLAALRRRA